ncbi:MAG: M13 family metallopeptidase, partial [Rhizobacter sp.]|nr:M13 family metallopeptidase [Chlorobiales bacterium]
GDFYFSGMDTASIETAGLTPLRGELAGIDSVNLQSLAAEIAHLQRIGASPAFTFYVAQDDKQSEKYAVMLAQGGLGLPDRDYYFNADAKTANIRGEYVKHLAAMFKLLEQDEAAAAKSAATVMKLETDLAKASRKLEALRDPQKNYNKMAVSGLNKLTPSISWKATLENLGVTNADTVIVGQPEFFTALEKSLKTFSIEEWKTYLRWTLVNAYAENLSRAFDKQNFYFYSTLLSGVKEQRPRWTRVVSQTDGQLGELIGQVYVGEYVPKGTKEKLAEIGANIREVYAERIRSLEWMSDSTKAKALNKLGKIVMKVGYPDKWKDMSALEISRTSYAQNVMRANAWSHDYMTAKFGKPVDRTEWGMYPQTYNAYYNPSNNEIVVPASNIIVPGYEGRLPDDAILYGIIGGSTFGHEITHGFDDQGSQYDDKGNLSNWWTLEDSLKFRGKTKRIVEQFTRYTVLDSLHLNGDATQGENIADLGGVVMGYEAFKKTKQWKEHQIIGGLTPDQRYFLGYAYAWMINMRPESLTRQVMTDVHSPAPFRVIGPVSNMPEFYTAFGIKEGDAMWRPDSARVKIW